MWLDTAELGVAEGEEGREELGRAEQDQGEGEKLGTGGAFTGRQQAQAGLCRTLKRGTQSVWRREVWHELRLEDGEDGDAEPEPHRAADIVDHIEQSGPQNTPCQLHGGIHVQHHNPVHVKSLSQSGKRKENN